MPPKVKKQAAKKPAVEKEPVVAEAEAEVEDEYASLDRFQAESDDQVKLLFGSIPLGQERPLRKTEREAVRKHWETKVGKDWPAWLMSFELFCATTNYEWPAKNENAFDGGQPFQTLMAYLLGHGNRDGESTLESFYYMAKDRQHGTVFQDMPTTNKYWDSTTRTVQEVTKKKKVDDFDKVPEREPYKRAVDGRSQFYHISLTNLGQKPKNAKEGNKVVQMENYVTSQVDEALLKLRSGPHQSMRARPSVTKVENGKSTVRVGYLTAPNGSQNNNQNSGKVARGRMYYANPHYEVYSKLDWVVKAGLRIGQRGQLEVSNTSGNNEFTTGVESVYMQHGCAETTAAIHNAANAAPKNFICVPSMNSIAAIYGLYYYPGCEEPEYNWTVTEYVPELDKYFTIRMRCPNPHYGELLWWKSGTDPIVDNSLNIYEPNNPLNTDALDTYYASHRRAQENTNNIVEEVRPSHYTLGGVLQSDYETTSQHDKLEYWRDLKADAKNRLQLPKVEFGSNLLAEQEVQSYWQHLIGKEKTDKNTQDLTEKSFIGPIWMGATGNTDAQYWYLPGNSIENVRKLATSLLEAELTNVHEPTEDGLVLGFRKSCALLMWPHRRVDDDAYLSFEPLDPNEAVPLAVPFMTEPRYVQTDIPDRPTTGLARHLLNYDAWLQAAGKWREALLDETVLGKTQPVEQSDEPDDEPDDEPEPEATGVVASSFAAGVSSTMSAELETESGDEDMVDMLPLNVMEGLDEENDLPDPQVKPGHTGNFAVNERQASQKTRDLQRDNETSSINLLLGTRGASLREALLECNRAYDFAEKDIRRVAKWTSEQVRIKANSAKGDLDIYNALKSCGALDVTLREGQKHRRREVQCHWRSAAHAPWSHSQCYETPQSVGVKLTPMTKAEAEAYAQRYGSDYNLKISTYEKEQMMKIEPSDQEEFGYHLQAIMQSKITKKSKLHRVNLAKILAIYYSPHGITGIKDKNNTNLQKMYSVQLKQRGMRDGVYCQKSGNGNYQKPQIGPKPQGASSEWLWGPVFDSIGALSDEMIEILTAYMCDHTNDSDTLEAELERTFGTQWIDEFDGVKSSMTVETWVTTPWHLNHLPYERQMTILGDKEVLSEGCRRCSRRFYEYAYHFHADKQLTGEYQYASVAKDLFSVAPLDGQHCERAPVPLSDMRLWGVTSYDDMVTSIPVSQNNVVRPVMAKDAAKKGKKKALPLSKEAELQQTALMASQGWPTYRLSLDNLEKEDTDRKLLQTHAAHMYFRRYVNVAYDDYRADGETAPIGSNVNGYYVGIAQGYVDEHDATRKLRYGMLDYRLRRSHKYGNVCTDCAGVLTRAPGLLIHNNRFSFDSTMLTGPQRNDSLQSAGLTQVQLVEAMAKGVDSSDRDPEWIKTAFMIGLRKKNELASERAKTLNLKLSKLPQELRDLYFKDFEEATGLLMQASRKINHFPEGYTRTTMPNIYIQKSITAVNDKEMLEDAKRDFKRLLQGEQLSDEQRGNPALVDLINEASRRLENDEVMQIDPTKQLDQVMTRTEYRNAVIRWERVGSKGQLVWLNKDSGSVQYDASDDELEGVVLTAKQMGQYTIERYVKQPPDTTAARVYYNCLLVSTLDPIHIRRQKDDDASFNLAREEHYRLDVYLSNRYFDQKGVVYDRPSKVPTMWTGDGFVTKRAPKDAERPFNRSIDNTALTEQKRAMRQSRLFITYSLHNAVNGEQNARAILERMADACYEVFGQDRYLSRILVFGKQLKGVKKDNVSKVDWENIVHTNKSDAMDKFYGSGDPKNPATSYVYDTYETHVDSIDTDGGIEIGPQMGHPHFHILLTINHFSYCQIDYFVMNQIFEEMFKGLGEYGERFRLPKQGGGNFYDPNERPYVDIRLYPQDNWQAVLAAYVRGQKGSVPSLVESARRVAV